MIGIGHNQPSFDDVVEENLKRGMLLTQRDALMRCGRDPRCGLRHIRVLCEIIEFTNAKSGVAYPGRKKIAERTFFGPGDVQRPDGYTEAVVAKTISELIRFGYLVQSQRAPESGGRALSHYSLLQPSIEDLQREIESWVRSVRAADPRPMPSVTFRGNTSQSGGTLRGNGTTGGNTTQTDNNIQQNQIDEAGVTAGSNVTAGVPTVTSNKNKNNIPPFGLAQQEDPKPKPKRTKPRSQINPDWQPSEADALWVRAKWVVTDSLIGRERDKFYNHHRGKGSLMADWSATWRTWWENDYHKIPRRAGSGSLSKGVPEHGLADVYAKMREEEDGDADRL